MSVDNNTSSKQAFDPYKRVKSLVSIILVLGLLSLFLNLGKLQEEHNEGPLIYTSFFPIYDLTRTVLGDADIQLKILMPAEQDPHMWEPTPRDIEKLSNADMLIINGANMEERWLAPVRESLPNLKVVNLSDGVDLITYTGAAALGEFQFLSKIELEAGVVYPMQFGHTHEEFMRLGLIKAQHNLNDRNIVEYAKTVMLDEGEIVSQYDTIEAKDSTVYKIKMGHTSGGVYIKVKESGSYYFVSDRLSEALLSYRFLKPDGEEDMPWEVLLAGSTSNLDKLTYDPHSWMSTTNAKSYLNGINQALAEAYPEYERSFNKNKVKAVTELSFLEHEYKKKFEKKENKVFVVTHYAYAYLARDFGIDQYPLQGLTSMGSISLHTLRRAIAFCVDNNIQTIFYEKSGIKKDAQTIAWEIGAQAKPLTSMEFVRTKDDMSYISIMRENLELLEQSMR
ncbi:MAG: zinc ABC transporter solute-binding protein [Christensenellaceae bacterium]|nr:zinc ABC transporter solute-binding protein [Christensenellaceae bacterium]